jgi:Tfp pilus assembly protein PilN
MVELDFLPEWYQIRQQRRRSYFAFVWLGACLLGAMGLWFYMTQEQIRQARGDVQGVAREQAAVKEQLASCDKLRLVRDEMRRKSDISRLLTDCPDTIHVLRKLVDLVPAEIALTGLDVGSEPIQAPSAEAAPARSRRSRPAESTTAKFERRRYTFRIDGVAPFDELIANMVTRLSNSDAFTNVQIVYTKDVRRSGRLMRQFELTCQLVDNWEATDGDEPSAGQAPPPAGHADGARSREGRP